MLTWMICLIYEWWKYQPQESFLHGGAQPKLKTLHVNIVTIAMAKNKKGSNIFHEYKVYMTQKVFFSTLKSQQFPYFHISWFHGQMFVWIKEWMEEWYKNKLFQIFIPSFMSHPESGWNRMDWPERQTSTTKCLQLHAFKPFFSWTPSAERLFCFFSIFVKLKRRWEMRTNYFAGQGRIKYENSSSEIAVKIDIFCYVRSRTNIY